MKQRTRVILLALVAGLFALPALPAAAAEPTLKVTLDRSIYTAGQTAKITAQVTATNLDYTISYQLAGSAAWNPLGGSRGVNTDTFRVSLPLAYNVKVRARLTDPEDGDAVKAEVFETLPVRSAVAIRPLGNYSASGRYAVFAKGKSPTFRSQNSPKLPAKRCLRHQVQRKYSSGWKTVKTSSCRTLDQKGRVDWKWRGKHASGVKFRVRATFAGDIYNRAGTSAWRYVRFR